MSRITDSHSMAQPSQHLPNIREIYSFFRRFLTVVDDELVEVDLFFGSSNDGADVGVIDVE